MKKLLLSLLVIFAVLGIGSYLYWQNQSEKVRDHIVAQIEKLNQQAKEQGAEPYVTYKSVTTAGYPTRFAVVFDQPVLTVPLAQLLPPRGDTAPNWVEKTQIDGTLTLSSNLTGNAVRVDVDGDSSTVSQIDGAPKYTRTTKSSGTFTCEVAYDRDAVANLKSFDPVEVATLMANNPAALQRIHCTAPAYESKTDGGLFASGKEFLLDYNVSESSKDRLKLAMKLKNTGVNYGAEADAYMQELFGAFAILDRSFDTSTLKFANYGEQNLSIDGDIEVGRTDTGAISEEDIDPQIHVREFSYDNDYFRFHNALDIVGDDKGKTNQFVVKWDNGFKAEAGFDKLLREDLYTSLKENPDLLKGGVVNIQTKGFDDVDLRKFVDDLLPALEAAGEIKQKVALTVTMPGSEAGDQPVDTVGKLDEFSFATGQWGLYLSGEATIPTANPMPKATGTLQCSNCGLFIGKLGDYLQGVEFWRVRNKDVLAPFSVSDALIADTKRFAATLANKGKEVAAGSIKDEDTYRYAINFADMQLTINELDTQQILALVNQFLSPHLRKKPGLPNLDKQDSTPSTTAPTQDSETPAAQ